MEGKTTNKDKWQDKFLENGKKNMCGDLSIMISTVSEIIQSEIEKNRIENLDVKDDV